MSVIGIIIAILVFGILVVTHEFGHFVMARICGVRVLEFSIGFGPRLFKFNALGTVFSVKAIPFGGACMMLGEDAAGGGDISAGGRDENGEIVSYDRIGPEDIPEDSFLAKKPWQKMLIAFFGPFFNFLLAFVLGVIITAANGVNTPIVTATNEIGSNAGIEIGDKIVSINGTHISTGADIALMFAAEGEDMIELDIVYERSGERMRAQYSGYVESYKLGLSYYSDEEAMTVGSVDEGSGAADAGIMAGDIITGINGTAISSGRDFMAYLNEHALDGSPVDLKLTRDTQEMELSVTPVKVSGITLGFGASAYRETANFFTAIKGGFDEVVYGIKAVIYSLRMLFSGKASINDMSGPVGIVTLIGDTVESSASGGAGFVTFNVLCIAILLSANLAIVNLLPFPALDGGRFIVSAAEWITGKKIPYKVESTINLIGLGILLLFILYITGQDILKLFR